MLIDVATPSTRVYDEVSDFARRKYTEFLQAQICARPDMFAYMRTEKSIFGCVGLYQADINKKLQLEAYVQDAFARISGDALVDRRRCGEIGTRAVVVSSSYRSQDISLALAAALIVSAHASGVTYLGFTSNCTTRGLARALDVQLIALGKPDLSQMDEVFQENWKVFFRVRQMCFGFQVLSTKGCCSALKSLERNGIRVGPMVAACM